MSIVGARQREVRIWLDAPRLRGFGVTADDVVRAVHAGHAELPGGRLETASSEYTFKTKGELETVEAFGDLVIAHRAGGPIHLRDVARVEDGLEDERTYAELDGERQERLAARLASPARQVFLTAPRREEAPANVHLPCWELRDGRVVAEAVAA